MLVTTKLGYVAVVLAFVAAVFSSSPASPAYAQTGQFGDVPADAFYAAPVNELAAAGVLDGTECAEGFCPDEAMDRKTMAVWVVRLIDGEDPPAVAQSTFTDVDGESYYSPFIERMAELGVTRGCGDGRGFCPDGTVTRAHMAVFLSRAYGLPDGPDPGFADVPSDVWYAADIARLAASGVTRGCGDGTFFCPEQPTTRAHMATFLRRAEQRSDRDDSAEQDSSELDPATTSSLGEVVSAGLSHSCGVRTDGTIACWGSNEHLEGAGEHTDTEFISVFDGKLEAPAGRFISVSAGGAHSCGVRTDQTVICWGSNVSGQLDAPAGRFTLASAGHGHSCGVRTDQTVTCWGSNEYFTDDEEHARIEDNRAVAPSGSFTMVATGAGHTCGLRTDQTVICWGDNDWGQTDTPAGRFTMVSTTGYDSCGLRTDQTVICWGPFSAASSAPAGRFSMVSVSYSHACGVRTDQTAVCWGSNHHLDLASQELVEDGKARAPSGLFISVSAGYSHSCGLRTDQTIVCWGSNEHFDPESGEFITDGKADAPSGRFGPS